MVTPRSPAAGSTRRRRSACRRAGRTPAAAGVPPRPRLFSLSRRMKRPRSSASTETSASHAGRQRADLVLTCRASRAGLRGHHRHHLFEREAERHHRAHRLRQAELRLAGERVVLVVGMLRRRAGRRAAHGCCSRACRRRACPARCRHRAPCGPAGRRNGCRGRRRPSARGRAPPGSPGWTLPSRLTKPPGCRVNGCARMSPGRSSGITRSRIVSASSPLAPLSGRPQSWPKCT